MNLRKYLYLDEDFINDAFSTINGFDYNNKNITEENAQLLEDTNETNVEKSIYGKQLTAFDANMTIVSKLQFIIESLCKSIGNNLPFYDSINDIGFSMLKREDFL